MTRHEQNVERKQIMVDQQTIQNFSLSVLDD